MHVLVSLVFSRFWFVLLAQYYWGHTIGVQGLGSFVTFTFPRLWWQSTRCIRLQSSTWWAAQILWNSFLFFHPRGLDVRFFVLCRSAPSTLGEKKSAVNSWLSHNIRRLWCCHLVGHVSENCVILENHHPNAIICDLIWGLTKLDRS